MTTELQRAMVRYEEARIQYKKAVLASLHGASRGEAIRTAIVEFQKANSELKRLQKMQVQGVKTPPKTENESLFGWDFVRRLLQAG